MRDSRTNRSATLMAPRNQGRKRRQEEGIQPTHPIGRVFDCDLAAVLAALLMAMKLALIAGL
jgi:hypothetical protein